jgi:hypothetical protein
MTDFPLAASLATWLVSIFLIYLAMGALFALAFAWRGARSIDPAAAEATWGFRILILPGAAALWPFLLVRWLRGGTAHSEETS